MKIVTICLKKDMLEIIRFQQFYVAFIKHIKTKSIDTL